MKALRILAGSAARAKLAEGGFDPSLFQLLLGASGGPKWLVLSQVDRVLSDLLARRRTPIHALGTSIGSWRHACLAQDDAPSATARLEERYIHQRYDTKPTRAYISEVSRSILEEVLGADGARQVVECPRIRTHIGTARGRGPAASGRPWLQLPSLGAAMASNALSRRLLGAWYQRVVFTNAADPDAAGMVFGDFGTAHAPLTAANLAPALVASGSIPMVLEPVRDPVGAPRGTYWDGGITDYHHDLTAYRGDGLVLFPHFYGEVIPGWFDKRLQKRRLRGPALDRVVILAPTDAFVRDLPGGKIPDRTDFETLTTDERIKRWRRVVERCKALADELREALDDPRVAERVHSLS
ncbi:MAG: patatin-like phospholipase family protein [Acidobacteriota bacterium]